MIAKATRIVLQARLGSRRLPGKALLPVGGMAMVVLAARRAGRNGADLVVATSTDSSDDLIESICRSAGVSIHRGELDNVYARFLTATKDLDDGALVVRLTADNVFPDGDLIDTMISQMGNSDYIATEWPGSGLPYGVSAEAFRLGALRQATPADPTEGEHVTSALRRTGRISCFKSDLCLEHLRATVDSLDDFTRVRRVFEGVVDPIDVPWRELCDHLAALPDAPRVPFETVEIGGQRQSRLTLGTAQFGMPYGIANTSGMPSDAELARIVHHAIDAGVTHIDTARAYEASEERLGAALAGGWRERVSLVTKLAPIAGGSPAEVGAMTEASIFQSCRALRTDSLNIVLLHRADTRTVAGGAAWERLLTLRERGIVEVLGISAQGPDEVRNAMAAPDVAAVQIPFNLLDRRWDAGLFGGVLVHARSAFLQGLLTGLLAAQWPRISGVDPNALVEALDELVGDLGREDLADLALAFVRGHAWIHSVVVGMESETQLVKNLDYFSAPALTPCEIEYVRQHIPQLPEALVNPALWPAR